MKKLLMLLFAMGVVYGCKNDVKTEKPEEITETDVDSKTDPFHWLMGTWTNKSGDMFSQETWTKNEPQVITAYSFRLLRKDTVFAERMTLERRKKNWFLTVRSVDDRDESPVTFKLISSSNKELVFENKEHDFPTRITYKNTGKNVLQACIEGEVYGEKERIEYSFSRKK